MHITNPTGPPANMPTLPQRSRRIRYVSPWRVCFHPHSSLQHHEARSTRTHTCCGSTQHITDPTDPVADVCLAASSTIGLRDPEHYAAHRRASTDCVPNLQLSEAEGDGKPRRVTSGGRVQCAPAVPQCKTTNRRARTENNLPCERRSKHHKSLHHRRKVRFSHPNRRSGTGACFFCRAPAAPVGSPDRSSKQGTPGMWSRQRTPDHRR